MAYTSASRHGLDLIGGGVLVVGLLSQDLNDLVVRVGQAYLRSQRRDDGLEDGLCILPVSVQGVRELLEPRLQRLVPTSPLLELGG